MEAIGRKGPVLELLYHQACVYIIVQWYNTPLQGMYMYWSVQHDSYFMSVVI